jgi:signal transduction histidine kinase
MLGTVNAELERRGQAVNLYVEFLDRARLPDQPDAADWAAFLASKYRNVRLDAILADGAPAIQLMAENKTRLFGNVPLVGIFPNFDDLSETARQAVTVQVTTGPHIDRTVDMALDQWPTARRLIIVSDSSPLSHHLAGIVRAAVAQRAGRDPGRQIDVQHVFDGRLEDLEAMLAALSRDNVVLYAHLSVDGTGRHYRPETVAARLAKSSAVPVYALFGSDVGTGVVGGSVNDPQIAGRVAVQAVMDLLERAGQSTTPDDTHYSSGPVVDWRQLRRWGLAEAALPPGTDIRHREPSLFEAHFAQALAGLIFIGILSVSLAVILVLYAQRGRLAIALQDANGRLEERVAERTRDIERALSGEREARRRLRTFLDMAAHEFKTPLAVIDSAAQMLEMLVDTAQEGVGKRLGLIRRSARRVGDLIETCLAGERIDEEVPVRPVPFAPATLIERVAERQRGHGAAIAVIDAVQLPATCVADPDLLGIALDALLDNARRYGGDGEIIDLEARGDGTVLVVSVADRGPGIPEEERERVFEKYYRGEGSRNKPGTGIGLSMVRVIAELHGGSVVHRPRPGGGSVFVLTIPLERTAVASSVHPAISDFER